jgi:hypothetical protein
MSTSIDELIADPRPLMRIEDVAAQWGCRREKVAWLYDNRLLRGFILGKPKPENIRIYRLEVETKRRLADMEVAEEELDRYPPPPPRKVKPEPAYSDLARGILAAVAAHSKDRRIYIYFVQCGDYVKIGKSAQPYCRIPALQTNTPYDIITLRVIHGSHGAEKAIHEFLSPYHHRFEWFRLDQALRSAINELPRARNKECVVPRY